MFQDILAMGSGGGGSGTGIYKEYTNVSGNIVETIGFEPTKMLIVRADYTNNTSMIEYYDKNASPQVTLWQNGTTVSGIVPSNIFTYSNGDLTLLTTAADNHVFLYVE